MATIQAESAAKVENAFAEELDPEHHIPPGFGAGWIGTALFLLALAFSAFQLFTSVYAILPSQVLRSVHVGFLVLVGAALLANHRATNGWTKALGWAIGITGFLVGLYQWVFYIDLINRAGELNTVDIIVGVISLIVLFATAWRMMGAALPIICLVFLAYPLLGQYLPSPLNHRGYSFDQVIEQMSFGVEGIYGIPVLVSATYIYLFVLFGTFLERAGMIQLFTDVSLGVIGGAKGGAAKVAVVASGLMGMISGSGVANVVTVGQFTIPLMIRFGYRPVFAGGVESTASMGGQIMPPVMGAVAFIMAENIGVPYSSIVKAAIIPAFLYFGSAFWMVHLEAGKRNLHGIPKDQLPNPLKALARQWFLVVPVAMLVYLLLDGYTPLFAGAVGLALTVIVILGSAIAVSLGSTVARYIFWIVVGLCAASFLEFGISAVLVLVAVLILLNAIRKGGRDTIIMCRDALADGARQALPVGLACAIVGVVIGAMTLTGAATSFGNFVVSLGGNSIFLCLILIMLTSLLLGTGLPTIPTYIITAALAAPALLKLGVPLIVSHMFVFYYGIIADLTPPVALAALAAAPIARASPDAIGWEASRIALAGFVIPFIAVYEPSLMLQDGGWVAAQFGYWIEVVWVTFKACFCIGMAGIAAIGYLYVPTTMAERILAGASAAFLIGNFFMSDEIGLALGAVLIVLQVMRRRRAAAA